MQIADRDLLWCYTKRVVPSHADTGSQSAAVFNYPLFFRNTGQNINMCVLTPHDGMVRSRLLHFVLRPMVTMLYHHSLTDTPSRACSHFRTRSDRFKLIITIHRRQSKPFAITGALSIPSQESPRLDSQSTSAPYEDHAELRPQSSIPERECTWIRGSGRKGKSRQSKIPNEAQATFD